MNFRRYMARALATATLITGLLTGSQIAFANGNAANSANVINSVSAAHEFAAGRVIVAFNEGYNFSDINEINSLGLSSLEIESVRDLGKARKPGTNISEESNKKKTLLITLKDKSKEAVLKAIQDLKKQSCVAYAEPDYLLQIVDTTPNDTHFGKLYGMTKIEAPLAWDKCTGSDEIVVGVIDTGIDYTHPDLIDNIWTNPGEIPGDGIDNDNNGYIDDIYGWDFCYKDNDPMDDNGHGTHCAGTIAGIGNNGTGVVGVSWNTKVAALKFLDPFGRGFISDAIEAINYANAMGFNLTSNSWGGGGYNQALYDAINGGGLFVAAAGNEELNNDANPHYPSSYNLDNIIAVAATDRYDKLADFSNYGQTSVDLAAPGVSIYSTLPGGGYGYMNGTSMATPHVSGAAALLLSANSSLTPVQLKDIILSTVDPVSDLDGMVATGGRLNVAKALDKVKGSVLIGDINIDGEIDSIDYSELNRYILKLITLTPRQLVAADVSGDEKVNSTDYSILNRYILEQIYTFPAGDKYTFTYGDVDNDNSVSNSDANIVASYLAGNTVLSNKQLLAADVNGDNVVDGVDLSMLYNYINGIMTYLPVAD